MPMPRDVLHEPLPIVESQAALIIQAFGGLERFYQLLKKSGFKTRKNTINSWQYALIARDYSLTGTPDGPKPFRSATDGIIPFEYWQVIKHLARLEGIWFTPKMLTPHHFRPPLRDKDELLPHRIHKRQIWINAQISAALQKRPRKRQAPISPKLSPKWAGEF